MTPCVDISRACVLGVGVQVILMHIPYLVFMTEIHCTDDLSEELSCLRGGGYGTSKESNLNTHRQEVC